MPLAACLWKPVTQPQPKLTISRRDRPHPRRSGHFDELGPPPMSTPSAQGTSPGGGSHPVLSTSGCWAAVT
jgi:hypothetical protein